MTVHEGLALQSRSGIPASIAYLRDAHPAEQWSHHANFGALAAFWQEVHGELRREGMGLRALMDGFRESRLSLPDFQRAFAAMLGNHLNHLNQHHQIEDRLYFPRFRLLDPRMVAGFDLLERDHGLIHHQLEATAASANRLLAALGDEASLRYSAADAYVDDAEKLLRLLDRHLADEEDLVIPALLEHGEDSLHA